MPAAGDAFEIAESALPGGSLSVAPSARRSPRFVLVAPGLQFGRAV